MFTTSAVNSGSDESNLLAAINPEQEWYQILGFASEGEALDQQDQAKRNFRQLILKNHPDRHPIVKVGEQQNQIAEANARLLADAYNTFEQHSRGDARPTNPIEQELDEFDRQHTQKVSFMVNADIEDEKLLKYIQVFLIFELRPYIDAISKSKGPKANFSFYRPRSASDIEEISKIILQKYRLITGHSPLLRLVSFYKKIPTNSDESRHSKHSQDIPRFVSPYVFIALLAFGITSKTSTLIASKYSLLHFVESTKPLERQYHENSHEIPTIASIRRVSIENLFLPLGINHFTLIDYRTVFRAPGFNNPWENLRMRTSSYEPGHYQALITMLEPIAMQPLALFRHKVQQIIEWEWASTPSNSNTSRTDSTTAIVSTATTTASIALAKFRSSKKGKKSALHAILEFCESHLSDEDTLINDPEDWKQQQDSAVQELVEIIQKFNAGRYPSARWQFIDRLPKLNPNNPVELKCFRLIIREFNRCFPEVNLNLQQKASDLKKPYSQPLLTSEQHAQLETALKQDQPLLLTDTASNVEAEQPSTDDSPQQGRQLG